MCVFIDESGNTGQNLLDRSQPVYALASVHFSHAETEAIYNILSTGKEKEIHFKNLKRSKSGKQRIRQFIQLPLLTADRIKIFTVHKPFMVIAKIVDLLVETLYFRSGIDIYKKGANIAMSNLFYYATPTFCGKERFARFQATFLRMIQDKDYTSIHAFYASIQELKDFCKDEKYKIMFDTLASTRGILDDVLPNVRVTTLDPAVPLLYVLCGLWGNQLGTTFNLVCDESKPIAHDKELLKCLMNPNIPEVRVGYDFRKITLPLKVNEISFVDSKEVFQVQIADILASSCTYWAKTVAGYSEEEDLSLAISNSVIPDLIINSIWPSPDVTPEGLGITENGGINPINYVAELLRRKPKGKK